MNQEKYDSWQVAADSISRNRANRANKLVLVLKRFGVATATIESATPKGQDALWALIEAHSTIRPDTLPTSPVTRGMALEILRTMEKVAGTEAPLPGCLAGPSAPR